MKNEKIGHLETDERKKEYIRRQKASNYLLNINNFLKKIDDISNKYRSKSKDLDGDDVGRLVQESIQGLTDDIKSTEFFEAGIIASKSVGKIETGIESGTGFLIGGDLLITNNHVIENKQIAIDSYFVLDYEDNFVGTPVPYQEFEIDPKAFFLTDKNLDFTIVGVKQKSIDGKSLSSYGFHPLISAQGKIKLGDAVNIIHHPGGNTKRVSFRNNQLIFIKNKDRIKDSLNDSDSYDGFCLYLADTLKGSSGAPVFNDRWEVIAIHHAGSPIKFTGNSINILDEEEFDNADIKANEGIRISRIVRAIENYSFDQNDAHMENKRKMLFQIWQQNEHSRQEGFVLPNKVDTVSHKIEASGLNITINIDGLVESAGKSRQGVRGGSPPHGKG